jgi:hypothetical protein
MKSTLKISALVLAFAGLSVALKHKQQQQLLLLLQQMAVYVTASVLMQASL